MSRIWPLAAIWCESLPRAARVLPWSKFGYSVTLVTKLTSVGASLKSMSTDLQRKRD
jgi:hypothetical protein